MPANSTHRVWMALALCGVPTITLAQTPEPLQRTARIWGCGWGDGYHVCSPSGCRPLGDLPPRSFASGVGTGDQRSNRCSTGQCGSGQYGSGILVGHNGGGTFYDRFDAHAHAVAMAQQATIDVRASRSFQPLADPEAGVYPTTAWPQFRMPRQQDTPTSQPAQPAKLDPPKSNEPEKPQLTPEELEDFRKYREHKRLQSKYEKFLIPEDDFEPSQQWGGPPAGSEERRKIDEQRVDARPPVTPKLRTWEEDIESEPASPSDIGAPSDSRRTNPMDDVMVPLDSTLPPFPTGLDDMPPMPRSITPLIETEAPASNSTIPQITPEPESIPTGTLQLETRGRPLNPPTLGRRYIQQPTPMIADKPERVFVKQPVIR